MGMVPFRGFILDFWNWVLPFGCFSLVVSILLFQFGSFNIGML